MASPSPTYSHTGSDSDSTSHRPDDFDNDVEKGDITPEHYALGRGDTVRESATQTAFTKNVDEFEDSTLASSGTITPASEQRSRNITAMFSEGAALIQVKSETRKQWSSNRRKGIKVTTKYFYQEIDSSWTVGMVIVCFFTAGLIDAIAYQCWGTFVSMQTGNTILVAVRISSLGNDAHPLAYVKNLVSIGSFGVGSMFFNVLHRYPSGLSNPKAQLHRWTLFTGFGVQSTLLIVTAILATTEVVSGTSSAAGTSTTGLSHSLDLVAIAFLAFEASGQVCLSRVTKINDLPTIVISTIYHDFIADTLNTRRCWRESKTNRDFIMTQKKQFVRVVCIVTLFLGALIGDFIYSGTGDIMGTLWLAAGLKLCICLCWCLWKKKVVTETVVTREEAEKKKQSQQNPTSQHRRPSQALLHPLQHKSQHSG